MDGSFSVSKALLSGVNLATCLQTRVSQSRRGVEIGKDIYIDSLPESVPMYVEEHSALERNLELVPYVYLEIEYMLQTCETRGHDGLQLDHDWRMSSHANHTVHRKEAY